MWKEYHVNTDFEITSFYSAFIRKCPLGYFFSGEVHNFWEAVFVVEGSACICADDKVMELEKNQMIFHHPMEFHSLRANCKTPTELLIISFSCSGKYMERFKKCVFQLGRSERDELAEILKAAVSCGRSNTNYHIPTDYLENLQKNPLSFKRFKNLTENFLIRLGNIKEIKSNNVNNMETSIYSDALKIIEQRVYDKMTVEQLASECNASVSYLKKIFAKYNGMGIHEYILNIKFSEARKMLSHGKSVTETAKKLGFSSQNYFSTAFKRVVGTSPGRYKKVN